MGRFLICQISRNDTNIDNVNAINLRWITKWIWDPCTILVRLIPPTDAGNVFMSDTSYPPGQTAYQNYKYRRTSKYKATKQGISQFWPFETHTVSTTLVEPKSNFAFTSSLKIDFPWPCALKSKFLLQKTFCEYSKSDNIMLILLYV